MFNSRWLSFGGLGALALAVAAASCGGSSKSGGSSGSGGSGSDGGPGMHGGSGLDATTGCSTDADCAASVPVTTPASCAVGKCNALQGVCEYVAKDQDGDGHAAANCVSTSGVAIQAGDDCNDQDPNVYPGHPETCSTTEDGGTPSGTLCVSGQLTCNSDGTESACTGTLFCPNMCVNGACVDCTSGQTQCVNNSFQTCSGNGTWGTVTACSASQTCVAGACTGLCGPGQMQCVGNGQVTCTTAGTWSIAAECVGQTCSNGTCQGNCAPGETACAGPGGVVTCAAGGTWGTPALCSNQTCVGALSGEGLDGGLISMDATVDSGSLGLRSASCQGVCAQNAVGCGTGQQPQTCDGAGTWQNSGLACSGSTPACTNGACGTCTLNSYGCNGAQPQQCNGTTWQNEGPTCAGTTNPACLGGVCVACNPGAQQCSSQQPQMCDTAGAWQNNGSACSASLTCVGGACTGVCGPGQTQCTSDTQVETCSTSGQWGTATTCTNACVGTVGTVGGNCGGVCVPGSTECASDTQVATCGTNGQWGSAATCTDACVGTGVGSNCGGVCVPGATQCSDSNGAQTCSTVGQWGPTASSTQCASATQVEMCGGGQWGSPSWACATGTCSGDACAGSTTGGSNPSCAPGGAGMTDCGASSESCCTSLEVTGGTYDRTYTNTGSGATGLADPATVSGFRMDKYLVTVGRFRQFVSAWNGGAGWLPPAGSGKHTHLNGGQGLANSGSSGSYETGWVVSDDSNIAPTSTNLACHPGYDTWTDTAGNNENLPINCVNWYEAYAFCIWDGGFLPSEAEWEYAAAGGSQQLEYPWGTTAPGTGNQYAIYSDNGGDCYYPGPNPQSCTGVANIAPVGAATVGAGLWGQLDLAGEMWEWGLDWETTYVDPCVDCAYVTAGSGYRVRRGGNFDDNTASDLLPWSRSSETPQYTNVASGLRCARTP